MASVLPRSCRRSVRTEAVVAALGAAGAVAGLFALRGLPYSSSWIEEAPSMEARPDGPRSSVGRETWEYASYDEAPSLASFRAYFAATCPGRRGLDAAMCLSGAFRRAFPHGEPRHEFVNATYDPAATLAEHLAGAPGHCVTRSALIATTLLAVHQPARVVQFLGRDAGHNLFEVWDDAAGWVLVDPTYDAYATLDGKPASGTAARTGNVTWKGAAGNDRGEHVEREILTGALLLPDPWLYTRVGRSAASWPFRGAFVRIGATGSWTYGRAQKALEGGIIVAALAFLGGLLTLVRAFLRPPAKAPTTLPEFSASEAE